MLTYAVECQHDSGMLEGKEERLRIREALRLALTRFEYNEIAAETGVSRQSLGKFNKDLVLGKAHLRDLVEWLEERGYLKKEAPVVKPFASVDAALQEFKAEMAILNSVIESDHSEAEKVNRILEFCLAYGWQAEKMLQRVRNQVDGPPPSTKSDEPDQPRRKE